MIGLSTKCRPGNPSNIFIYAMICKVGVNLFHSKIKKKARNSILRDVKSVLLDSKRPNKDFLSLFMTKEFKSNEKRNIFKF